MDLSESQDSGKRGASSSPVKEKLAELKKLRTSQDTANPVLDAINALSDKMDKMAMKSDLEEMRTHLTAETKIIVAEAVDPLKSEMHDVRHRVDGLSEEIETVKSRLQAVEAAPVRHEQEQSEEIKALRKAMTNLQRDVKGGQVLFLGFPLKMPDDERLALIDSFVQAHAPDLSQKIIKKGSFHKGAGNEATSASYIEFLDSGSAKSFLNKAKGKSITAQGSTVNIKGPRGPFQIARNDSLRAALKTAQEVFPQASTSIDWMERVVKKDDETVYKQPKNEIVGQWVGSMLNHKE